ncbi:MAG TPA: GNAT family N-acetyltransferase [Bacteroidia bacterium]|nr:GNAT family N-acetyltransferase [Bacteroidia bacterium]
MEIEAGSYDKSMKQQVAALFSMQYGVSEKEFTDLIGNFYEHPYQAEKCIRIVALDGEKVVGFQSFFLWPYEYQGKVFRSYQSGNSLVHPDYRGKGIFQKLLHYLEKKREELGVEFIMGFPINVSRNSLIRNGWKNIVDLQWYVKPVRFLPVFGGNEDALLRRCFSAEAPALPSQPAQEHIRLTTDPFFREWRKNYSTATGHYYWFAYEEKDRKAVFQLKLIRRKKLIRELIVGDVIAQDNSRAFLAAAFTALAKAARKTRCVHLISFAVNPASPYISHATLADAGMNTIDRHIFFAVKPFAEIPALSDPSKWILFRSDIDTW